LNRNKENKIEQDYEKFEQVFRASRDPENDTTFHRLVDAVSNVIHDFSNRFDTYTPQSTAQTFAPGVPGSSNHEETGRTNVGIGPTPRCWNPSYSL